MKYPLHLMELENGLCLYIPVSKMVKPTYGQLLLQDAKTPFPFWAKIWPSSVALSNFLQANSKWIENKKILEIGAGIGLPSFSIATKASEVLITDQANDAVDLMQENINYLNLINVHAACIDWNYFPTYITADTILLSDINYAPEQFEPLLNLLIRFIEEGSTLILATPQRIMGISFIESIQHYIRHSETETILEKDTEVMISLYVLYK